MACSPAALIFGTSASSSSSVVGTFSPSFAKMSLLYATLSVFRSIGIPKILFL